MKRKTPLAAAVLAAAMVLTACGGSPTAGVGAPKVDDHAKEVYDEINGLSGEERTDKLVEMAEEEGKLVLYTSNTDMDSLVEAFEKKYDITVEPTRGNSETVLQRLTTEGNSGNVSTDLVETNSGELNILAQEGFLYDYESEYRDAVREDGQLEGWTADRFNAFVVAWNTDKVKSSEIPGEVADFADPKWDGKVALEIGDVDWFAAVSNYYLDQGKSQAEVDKMWTDIAANASVEKGHSTMGDMLAAGKLHVVLSSYSHTVDGLAGEDKAPVTWKRGEEYVAPVVTRPNGAGLMATAKHPAAATLFMDFLLSEGQQYIAEDFRSTAVPQEGDPLEGVETIPVPEGDMLEDYDRWDRAYRELVGG
ncbi:extracellular solute-binding protein [Nocardioides sp. NBC_00163]|uniref:ABC transporter substrate-binding protein n=1 Tax=Nocardioides sp. NBC_00163 TaxID=2975999 RepID=UPI00324EDC22